MGFRNMTIRVDEDGNVLVPNIDDNLAIITGGGLIDLFTQTTLQQFPLGSKVIQGDRAFRYVKCGGSNIAVGLLTTGPASGADHIKDLAVAAAAAIGAKSVTITNGGTTAITANMFAGGYLFVNDVDGEGQCLRIRSHPAAATSASCAITTYDPLTVALTTNSQCGIKKNPYDAIVVSATTPVAVPVGVTCRGLTANYYGWLQTFGPCAVLCNGTHVVGKPVEVGLTTAGSVDVGAGTTGADAIGVCMSVGASTEYSLIFLTLDG